MQIISVENPDGKWFVYDNDYIGRELEAGERWEPWVLDAMKEHSNPEGVFVDVGAYIGTHTVPAARWFRSVIAYEPYPLFGELLRRNIELNELSNVDVRCKAVGEDCRTIRMFNMGDPLETDLPMNYAGDSTISLHRNSDDICAEQISLDSEKLDCAVLKIDTQGTEFRVLLGAKETIKRCRPVVFVEGSQKLLEQYRDSFADIRRLLRTYKYHIERIRKNTADFIGIPK